MVARSSSTRARAIVNRGVRRNWIAEADSTLGAIRSERAELEGAIKLLDTNGDGHIDEGEFVRMYHEKLVPLRQKVAPEPPPAPTAAAQSPHGHPLRAAR